MDARGEKQNSRRLLRSRGRLTVYGYAGYSGSILFLLQEYR
jgi:hypothetical protein